MLIENKNIQKIDINSLKMSTQSINERYSKLSEPPAVFPVAVLSTTRT